LARGLKIKKAIIFSISPDLEFKMDYSGKFGVGPNTFIIPFKTIAEGKRLERFLNSEDYKTLALATKTTRQYLKIAFIEHLKLTKIMGTNNMETNNMETNNMETNNTKRDKTRKTCKNKTCKKNKTRKNKKVF
jgi:hypothetical protein